MVVTGAGVVSCLGVGVEHVWAQVCAGRTGISAVAGEGRFKESSLGQVKFVKL